MGRSFRYLKFDEGEVTFNKVGFSEGECEPITRKPDHAVPEPEVTPENLVELPRNNNPSTKLYVTECKGWSDDYNVAVCVNPEGRGPGIDEFDLEKAMNSEETRR